MKNLKKYIEGFDNGLYTDKEGKENCFTCNDCFSEDSLKRVVERRKNKKTKIKLYLPKRLYALSVGQVHIRSKYVDEFFDKEKSLGVKRTHYEWQSITEWWENEYNIEIFGVEYDTLKSDTMWFAVWGEGDQECWGSKGDSSMAKTVDEK
jgi:hypothetical protein